MKKKIGLFLLLPFLISSSQDEWDAQVVDGFARVCGFCHYDKYMDYDTDTLIQENIIANAQAILNRLNAGIDGKPGAMPPTNSPLKLESDLRQKMIETLQPYVEVSSDATDEESCQ